MSGVPGRRMHFGAAAVLLLVVGMAPGSGSATVNPFVSVETRDGNGDGRLDRLVVTFRADPGPIIAGRFLVGGYSVASIARTGAVATVALAQSAGYDTGVKPDLAFHHSGRWWLFSSSSPAYTDAAAPVLVSATGRDFARPNVFLDPPAGNRPADTMTLRFSEPVMLSLNAAQNPAGASAATTPADKHVALEQALQLNGHSGVGCGKDGDGLNGSNFPRPGPDTGRTAVHDPIDFGSWPGGARVGATSGDQIIVTAKPGSAPSTPGWVFAIRPAHNPAGTVLAKCTFTVAQAANIIDAAKNALSTRTSGVTIVHEPGALAAAPVTGDRDNDGIIDQITLVSHHVFEAASVTATALGRLTIADPGNPGVRATNSTIRAVNGQTLTIGFTPPGGWTRSTTPLATYAPTADCLGSVIRIMTPAGDQQCLGAFSLRAVNGTGR